MSESKEQQQTDLRLPWSVGPEPVHGWCIRDANGSRVVRDIYWEEHARLIIRAVNSHQALVEVARLASTIDVIGSVVNAEIRDAAVRALAALAEKGN